VLPEKIQDHGPVGATNLARTQDFAVGPAMLQYHWIPECK